MEQKLIRQAITEPQRHVTGLRSLNSTGNCGIQRGSVNIGTKGLCGLCNQQKIADLLAFTEEILNRTMVLPTQ